jgi:hypothetical protein
MSTRAASLREVALKESAGNLSSPPATPAQIKAIPPDENAQSPQGNVLETPQAEVKIGG